MDLWYTARGISVPPASALPKIGFIVDNIAAGFLYQTDSSVTLLEGFITNQDTTQAERDAGLDQIVKALMAEADTLGATTVLAMTQSQAIYNRACKFGFSDIGAFQLLTKALHKERD